MTWLDFGGQGSKVTVTALRRGGEGIHVDVGRQSLSSCLKSPGWAETITEENF